MKYVFGILIMVVGFFMVAKTAWFIQNFGSSSWAEQKIGPGGTHLMYKVLGVILIIGALMAMTGMLGEIIIGTFGRLFGL